ncbi:MAG: T9SS type A sorting domain-containing protein [Saprospiraceae bacterium]|nr:T9SS type A sorting domain-containing protein [Saprospiraceae bacterium]
MTFTNSVQAQQTLCQQLGGNFVPNITIGVDESSVTSTSSLLGIAGWINQKVLINGTLVVNSNFLISGCSLKMGKNAVIRIDPNITFQSVLSKYFRCGNDFWKGFVVLGGTADFWFNHIEDASIALDIKSSSASLIVVGNKINRNNKGLFAENVAVNAIVAANTFDCTSPLNGSVLPFASAGIELINCSAVIGRTDNVPAYRNVFRKQNFGIKLSKSTVIVGLSTFNNNGIGVSANSSSNVTVRGVDAGLTTNTSLNGKDIYTERSSLKVFHCLLDSCKEDNISALMNKNLEEVHVFDNTIRIRGTAFPKYGIKLDRTTTGQDDQFRNTIRRNRIELANNKGWGAIYVTGFPSTRDKMLIDSNIIDVGIGRDKNFVSVFISSAENFIITRNGITSTNTYSTGDFRWAFFLTSSISDAVGKGNLFSGNSISGNGVPDNGCCAVHAVNAGSWTICNNMTDLTYKGFHFIGDNDTSIFALNTIGNHDCSPDAGLFSRGLEIHGGDGEWGRIGDQVCSDNTWTIPSYPGSSSETAYHLGDESFSEFYVPDMNDPNKVPTDRSPGGEQWFKLGQCLQAPDCSGNIAPNIDEYDEWVRTTYPVPQTPSSLSEWQDTRSLISKLMRYPLLATGDMLAFKNAYSQSSSMLFARFDSLMNALSVTTASSQTTLKNLDISIQGVQAQISALDALVSDTSTIPAGLMTSRATLLNELVILSNQRNYLLEQNSSAKEPILNALEVLNNTLPANQVFEQNQKVINAIAINQARGLAMSQQDSLALYAISQQCVQIAGRTKGRAASMLPPESGAHYWVEHGDDSGCPPVEERNITQQASEFSLSPNPCTSNLNVHFNSPFVGNISILDVSGRVVQQQVVHEKLQVLNISVEQLSNGVYILACKNATGEFSSSSKFVVLR